MPAAIDCGVLLLVALAFRLPGLGHASLWSDEVFSVYWSQLDPWFLLGRGSHIETNPPTYYLLLHEWIGWFGSGAVAVRSASVLVSLATVLTTYAIGRQLMGRPAALLAGLFLALDTSAIHFAQEARGYALLTLFDALALLGLCGAFASVPGRRLLPWVALFSTSCVAAFLTHYTALFFVAACFAVIGLRLLRARLRPRRELLAWLGSGAFVAACIAAPLAVAGSMSHSANIYWFGPLSGHDVRVFFREILTYPEVRSWRLAEATGILLILFVAAGLVRRRPDSRQAGALILVPAAFCILLIGTSLARPLLVPRVGAWLSVPVCLLLAYSAMALQHPFSRRLAAVAVSAIFVGLAIQHRMRPVSEDWNEAMRIVADEPRCRGPLILFGPHNLDAAYYRHGPANQPGHWVPQVRGMPETAESVLNRIVTQAVMLPMDDLPDFMASHPGAALLVRPIFRTEVSSLLGEASSRMRFRDELPGGLTVICR